MSPLTGGILAGQFAAMKVLLTPHQEKFIAKKMKSGGYASQGEVVREALRVYELMEQEDYDPTLERELRDSLNSPLKKYRSGHFAALASRAKQVIRCGFS
jgi:putative addiction module CopG family antidote